METRRESEQQRETGGEQHFQGEGSADLSLTMTQARRDTRPMWPTREETMTRHNQVPVAPPGPLIQARLPPTHPILAINPAPSLPIFVSQVGVRTNHGLRKYPALMGYWSHNVVAQQMAHEIGAPAMAEVANRRPVESIAVFDAQEWTYLLVDPLHGSYPARWEPYKIFPGSMPSKFGFFLKMNANNRSLSSPPAPVLDGAAVSQQGAVNAPEVGTGRRETPVAVAVVDMEEVEDEDGKVVMAAPDAAVASLPGPPPQATSSPSAGSTSTSTGGDGPSRQLATSAPPLSLPQETIFAAPPATPPTLSADSSSLQPSQPAESSVDTGAVPSFTTAATSSWCKCCIERCAKRREAELAGEAATATATAAAAAAAAAIEKK
ncbi:hypothetical protein MKZ38_009894 [Zalerion maritima]|uniref:Uncharacterized protein n=1 Tax=Zalerion maritima TaxID=339359 RepID=A0AAD5WN19_9PEZI|nr:hypothetical protein MKZ38_009894 [Zalerion maritima]